MNGAPVNDTGTDHVLLVDDNPGNLQVLYHTLAGQGYRLLIAKNGEDALRIAHKARPDLILLDIMMPGMDGYATCRALREDPTTAGVPVIFLSALNDTHDKVAGFEAGGVDYITKPFQAEEVIARVGAHLRIHRLEQALADRNRELEDENRRILEAMGEGLLSVDTDGRVRYANPAARRILGRPAPELAGRPVTELFECARTGETLPLARLIAPDRATEGEAVQGVCGDGGRLPVEYTATPVDSDSGFRCSVLVFRDITRRCRDERALREAQEHLVQAARLESVGRLAAGVAHEVKNPLAIIQLGLDLLQSGETCAGPLAEVLTDMGNAVERADRVVKGLLDFSRADTPEAEVQDINDVVREALRLVRHELEQHGIMLTDTLSASPLPVEIDRAKINQVLINLCMNAVQAMGHGGTLSVRSESRPGENLPLDPELKTSLSGPGSVIVVEIADTGSGIGESAEGRLFDPFFTTKPVGQGTGLGLSVTRTIMRQHGASLTLGNRVDGAGAIATLVFRRTGEDR